VMRFGLESLYLGKNNNLRYGLSSLTGIGSLLRLIGGQHKFCQRID
jgi:hypothetical protein